MSYNSRDQVISVPSGCLANTEINLQCKSPVEAVYYQFSMSNRLSSTEIISEIQAQPADKDLIVDQISFSGQIFKVRISGGKMNIKIGIRFLVITRDKAVYEFDVTLPIAPAGIVGSGNIDNYVIGNTGPVGPRGRAGTITVGKVIPSDVDSDAQVVNVADNDIDVKLNFILPRGLSGAKGVQGDKGKDGTQVLIFNNDPKQEQATENIVWLNDISGDLFKTNLVNNRFEWNKLGNLKGNSGSIIYSGDGKPVIREEYKTGDIYIDFTASELFNFEKDQWIKILSLQGDKGERGSLWFSGKGNPIVTKDYNNQDLYLNTETNVLFVFDEGSWKEETSLRGEQGNIGPQGDNGVTPIIEIGNVTLNTEGQASVKVNPSTKENTIIFDFVIPKGDIGVSGLQGADYTNDGSVDLDVKSITSDKGTIKSDGNGVLQAQHLKSENGWFYTDTTDYSTGSVYYQKMPYASFRGWKMIDDQILAKKDELNRSLNNFEDKFEIFMHSDDFPDAQGSFNMSVVIDAFVGDNHEKRRLAVLGTDRVIGHEAVEFGGGIIGVPSDPFYVCSRLVRILPKKLSDIKIIKTSDIDTITSDYMAGSIGLSTNYFTKSDDDGNQDGFITPVIWDKDTQDVSQARALGVPYIPADKKDMLFNITNIPVGTQSFDLKSNQPCWWDGNQWNFSADKKISQFPEVVTEAIEGDIYLNKYNQMVKAKNVDGSVIPVALSNQYIDFANPPTTIINGAYRYNTTTDYSQIYVDGQWHNIFMQGKISDGLVARDIQLYRLNFIDSGNGQINFPNMLNNTTATEMNGGVKYKYFERSWTDAELEKYIYPAIEADSNLTDDEKVEKKAKAKTGRTSSGLFPNYSVMQVYNPHATNAINVNNFYFDGTIKTTGPLCIGDISSYTNDTYIEHNTFGLDNGVLKQYDSVGKVWNTYIISEDDSSKDPVLSTDQTYTYLGGDFILLGRGNSWTNPAWNIVSKGAIDPKTSKGAGLQYWDDATLTWTVPKTGVLTLNYNFGFNTNGGTGIDGTIFQENDELWIAADKQGSTGIPSGVMKHSLTPYQFESNGKLLYKPSLYLNGSLSMSVTKGDKIQFKIAWYPKQLFTSTNWEQRIQISPASFTFYVS